MKRYFIEGPFSVERWRVVSVEGLIRSIEHPDCHTEKEARDYIDVCKNTEIDEGDEQAGIWKRKSQ